MTFRFSINLYQVYDFSRGYADDLAIVVRGKFDIRNWSAIISKVPNKSIRMNDII
jgi:hypothetical protein